MMEPVTNILFTISVGGLFIALVALATYVLVWVRYDIQYLKDVRKIDNEYNSERIERHRTWVGSDIDRLKDLEKKNFDMIWNESGRLDKLIDYLGLEEKKCDRAEIVKKGK